MTRCIVDIDRVVVTGAGTPGLDPVELRRLVQRAVTDRLAETRLPTGPAARNSVRIEAPSITRGGAPEVAAAIAAGVARATGGERAHG
jgi:hypothetical protein